MTKQLISNGMNTVDSALFLQSFNTYAPAFSDESQRLWQIAGRPQKPHPSLTATWQSLQSEMEADDE